MKDKKNPMPNNYDRGKLRFLIYGSHSKNHFTGICYEMGLVEEGETAEEVQRRLINGAQAIFEACKKEKMPLVNINTKPPLKYAVLFYTIPFLYSFLNISKIIKGVTLKIFDQNLNNLKVAC